jgi:cytochrome bd-type quinol oxidase subunit 1
MEVLILLMIIIWVNTYLSYRKKWYWGLIIPTLFLIAGIYFEQSVKNSEDHYAMPAGALITMILYATAIITFFIWYICKFIKLHKKQKQRNQSDDNKEE